MAVLVTAAEPVPFSESVKNLLKVRKGKVRELFVPSANYLAVTGDCRPGEHGYIKAVEALYNVAYAIKFLPKGGVVPLGYENFSIGAYECQFLNDERSRWRLLLMQPDFVTREVLVHARLALERRRRPTFDEVSLERWEEGEAMQALHIGPYNTTLKTVEILHLVMQMKGYTPSGPLHEIYLNDPHQAGSESARTIVRVPIRKR